MSKKCLIPFLCVLLSLVLYGSAFATTYYVATNGDNSYNGLYPTHQGGSNGPWRSVNYGVGQLAAGDTLYIRGGTYQEVVTINADGTESNQITIAGYPGETAIIDGYDTLPTSDYGVLLRVKGDYVTVRDIEVKNSNWMGVVSHGIYSKIINVYSHHNNNQGILLNANYGLIANCRVYWNGKRNEYGKASNWSSGCTAARHPYYCIIRDNRVWNNWGEGISTYEAEYTIIEDNVVWDNYSVNIYISDTRHTIAQRNLVYRTPASIVAGYGGAEIGIAISNEVYNPSVQDNTIINNLVMGAKQCIYFMPGSLGGGLINTIIANNTLVNSVYWATLKINSGSHSNTRIENNIVLQEDSLPVATIYGSTSGLTFSNNCWSKTPPSAASGAGDVVDDPKLTKAGPTGPGSLTPEWFEILSNSPARDRAKVIIEVTEDFFGTPRGEDPDIGGHEYGGSDPHPPDPPTGLKIF